jgi:MFS family permease
METTPTRQSDASGLASATWGLFTGLALIMLSGGIFSTLLGVRAELKGLPTIVSGGLTAAYYAGFLAGSSVTLRALGRVGHIRAFAGLAAVLTAAVLMIGLTDMPVVWLVFRVVTGFGFAGLYVVAESWLNGLVTNEIRGRLLSVYSAVVIGAFGVGQLVVFSLDARSLEAFAVAAVIASLGVVPVAMSQQAATPLVEDQAHMSLKELARTVPTGAGATLLVGMAHGATLGLAAIYATREGLSVGRTGLLLAAVEFGGMLMNWPLSAASDDIDRRVMGVVACLGTMGAAGLLMLGPASSPMAILLMAVIGGFSSPLYSISGAYTNDWIDPEHLSAAASQLVRLYGIGAMAGPFVASVFMDQLGTDGFAWSIIVLHALVAVFFVYRIRAWHAPLTRRPWSEVSVPARAFFIPATVVSMGVRRRRRRAD